MEVSRHHGNDVCSKWSLLKWFSGEQKVLHRLGIE